MIAKILVRHLKARPFSSALTVFAVALALTFLGSFWTLSENLEQVRMSQTEAGADPTLTFFVDPSLKPAEITDLKNQIQSSQYFNGIESISPEMASSELEKQFGKALTDALGSETFPLMLKAKLSNSQVDINVWNGVVNEMRSLPGVLDVDDGSNILPTSKTEISSKIFSWSTIFLIASLLVVSLLVSHLIRLIFESNKEELDTLKVLGASKSWIFMPILVESALIGLVSALIALGAIYWSVSALLPQYSEMLLPAGATLKNLSASSSLGIVMFSVFAAVLGALFTWPMIQQAPEESR